MKKRILPKKPKIKDLIDNYLNVHAPHVGMKGIDTATANCTVIERYFGKKRFDDIKVVDIVSYLNARRKDVGENTIRREMSVLRAICSAAVTYELFDIYGSDGNYSNDYWTMDRLMRNISKLRPKAVKRKERPPLAQIQEILKIIDLPMGNLIHAALLTAYRKDELLTLEWSDIKLADREMSLDETKNGYGRLTPLYKELYQFFVDLKKQNINNQRAVFCEDDGSPVKYFNTYPRWRTACKNIGHPEYHFHDLRKSAIRFLMEEKGFDQNMIMDCYSGHRSESIFQEIYNVRSSDTYLRYYKKVALNKNG